MTMAVPGSGGVAEYDPSLYGDAGLEDIGSSDVIVPRLRIVHDEAVFENNLTHEKFDRLNVVLLGLIKQRIMWADDVQDGDGPQCKSPDFDHGFPNMRDDVRKDTLFPWVRSNFDPSQAQPLEIAKGANPAYPDGYSSNGHAVLPCTNCVFQQWDKGDWKAPPCSEQHTYPLMYQVHAGDELEDWLPALLTVQKTGIKPSRTYISSFATSKTPMFTVFTELSLNMLTRGSVKYSVPVFKRGAQTDRESWREYADRQRSIRTFVRSAPRPPDAEESAPPAASANVNTPPEEAAAPHAAVPATPVTTPPPAAAAATPAPVAATAPAAAAPVADDDEDLPF